MTVEKLEKKTFNILLKTPENAANFVNTINTLKGEFDISMGRYYFDAKSLLGVLSMDPSRVMELHVNGANLSDVNTAVEPFLA